MAHYAKPCPLAVQIKLFDCGGTKRIGACKNNIVNAGIFEEKSHFCNACRLSYAVYAQYHPDINFCHIKLKPGFAHILKKNALQFLKYVRIFCKMIFPARLFKTIRNFKRRLCANITLNQTVS